MCYDSLDTHFFPFLFSNNLNLACFCSENSETSADTLDHCMGSNVQGGQLSQWRAQVLAALKVGAGEFQSVILKVI